MNNSEESKQKLEGVETKPDIDIGKAIATLRQTLLLSISEFSMRTGYSRPVSIQVRNFMLYKS
jgi:hypothetical protein